MKSINYSPPRLALVLLSFVLIGPPIALWSAALVSAVDGAGDWTAMALINALLLSITAAPIWYVASLLNPQWLALTWLPTLLAAAFYWVAMRALNRQNRIAFTLRKHWVLASILVSTIISTATFAIIAILSAVLAGQYDSSSMNFLLRTVALIGSIVGTVIGLFSRRHSA